MRTTARALMTGLALAALLTGCSSAQPPSSSTSIAAVAGSAASSAATPTRAAASVPSSASAAPAPVQSPAARKDPDAPAGQCADSMLKVGITETGGGLGSRQDLISFQNTGPTPCTLAGAPGVSVVGAGNGTQLGKPAGRSPGASDTTRLQPGESVTAQLDRLFVDGSTTTFRTDEGQVACEPKQGDGYRVYPPHSFKAVFVEHRVWACTSGFVWMRVAPVVAGK